MGKKITLAFAALAVVLSMQAFAGEGRPGGNPCGPDVAWRGGRGHGPAMGRHDRRPGKDSARGPMGPRMFGFDQRMMDELELTDAQKTQMVDVLTANFREGLLARMELADAHKKARELTKAEKPDSQAIIAANEALGAARGKMKALGLAAREDLRKILTAEQQTKLDEMQDGRRGDRDAEDGPRHGRRHTPRHGGFGPGPRMEECE